MAQLAEDESAEALIQEAAKRLIGAADPTKLILFGSYAHGDYDKDSDLDFLVIVPEVRNRLEEISRLAGALSGLGMSRDILLYTEAEVAYSGHLPGTALRDALTHGRVLFSSGPRALRDRTLREGRMPLHEYALELIERAAEDEYVVDMVIEDPRVTDAIILFHCQQAAEKLLKALLIELGVEFERTHSLERLIDLLAESDVDVPEDISAVRALTPLAVAARYARIEIDFDRRTGREMVRAVRDWVGPQVEVKG